MPTISNTRFVIAVPDLHTSAAFYRNALGFKIETIPDPGWLFYHCGDCLIMAGECPNAIHRQSWVTTPTTPTCKSTTSMVSTSRFELSGPQSARPFATNRGACASLAWSPQMDIELCTDLRSRRISCTEQVRSALTLANTYP